MNLQHALCFKHGDPKQLC